MADVMTMQTPVCIIGSGIAGLCAALHIAEFSDVLIVTKRTADASSTFFAQGGIAAALDESADLQQHINDTLEAGDGLCDPHAVESILRDGAAAVRDLIKWGVDFSRDASGAFDRTKEGGHHGRRIMHTADRTGRAISDALLDKVRAHPRITLLEHHVAIDCITNRTLTRLRIAPGDTVRETPHTVYGLYALNLHTHHVVTIHSRVTILASGGSGKVYLYTTNPDVASGDGLAMAYRVGARIANLEFMQFHPTCLYHPLAKSFLISEAVRGEGGVLKLPNGARFMAEYDARGELATRDIVARAIDAEIKRHGLDYVHLDISHRDSAFIRERFPNIYETCLRYGIDITQQPIPVVPAAHYLCGGVMTNLAAQTDIANLLAIGEVAYTGLHGANRLASNSLLEGAVMAERAARTALELLQTPSPANAPSTLPAWDATGTANSDEEVVINHNWDELRRTMWNYVGIVRSNKRLQRARARIELLQREIDDYYWNFTITNDLVELRNLALVAALTVQCAEQRDESRGLHYNIDVPTHAATSSPSIVRRAFA